MTSGSAPSIHRRRLRTILRRFREERALTQDQVAVAMDWSLSKVIRIESGTVGISVNDLKVLLDFYQVTEKASLIELARSARRAPWWQSFRDQMTPRFTYFAGLEPNAAHIQHFQGSMVPGLVQTMEYAAEALRGTTAEPISEDDLTKRLEIRRGRQNEFFGQADPPRLEIVLDEAVIRRRVGATSVMRSQLERLIGLNGMPHVTIQVVPFSSGIHPGYTGPFIIMDFDEDDIASVLYREGPFDDATLEQGEDLEVFRGIFKRLQSMALSPDETSDFIRRAAAELD